MHLSFLCGDLPPEIFTSRIVDAIGSYPGGVWDNSLLYVTARPATKAQVTALLLAW